MTMEKESEVIEFPVEQDKPKFPPDLVITHAALVVDRNGVCWWVRPEAMQIVKI